MFDGKAGKVTIKDGTTPNVTGLTFHTDGYEITGGSIALTGFNGSASTRISVNDEKAPTGGTATISSTLTGSQTIDKVGAGTLILTGNNDAYGGDVTVSAGTLVAGGGHAIGDQSKVNVDAGATFKVIADETLGKISGPGTVILDKASLTVGADDGDSTLDASLSGDGGLTKTGKGTLSVSGTNTQTGGTTIAGGGLVLSGSLTGDVKVQDKAWLSGKGNVDGTVHVLDGGTLKGGPDAGLSMGGLDVASKGTLSVSLAGASTTGVYQVKGDVTLNGTVAVTTNPGFGLGVYRIADYTGHGSGGSSGVSGLGANYVGGVQTSIDHQINLIVEDSGSPAIAFWNGANLSPTQTVKGGSGTWSSDANHTNWVNDSGTISRPAPGGFSVFQGEAGTITVDASAGAVGATGLQFATNGYVVQGDAITLPGSGSMPVRVGDGSPAGAAMTATIAADLTGRTGLEKTDLGTLILTGAKSYTGVTTVTAGTLQLGDGVTAGSVSGDIVNNAALVFAPGGSQTYAGAISGTGSLLKQGPGTLSLSGSHSYTGATTVAGGRLDVNGSLAASSGVTVHSGATLGGAGTVGAVLVETGGTVAGIQGQTLTTGNLTLSPGTHVSARLGESATGSALFSVKGDLTLNGILDVSSETGRFGAGLYRIMSYTGTLSGSGLSVGMLDRNVNVPDLSVETDATAKTVSLLTRPGVASFWNGGKPGAGLVEGGDGTWTANTIWTNARATTSTNILEGATAIFTGAPGKVRVDASAGPVSVAGMQFVTSGYAVQGDPITVRENGLTVRVGDGTKEGAAVTATIATPLAGTGALHKTDYGTLILSGTNTYSGGTSVEAGTLKLASSGAVGSNAVSLNEGTVLSFAGDLALSNALVFPQVGDPVIDTEDHTVTLNGGISGVGDLSKIGSGTLILSGTNTYTGATDVVAGTLVVDGSIAASSGVKVETGATLGGSGTVAALTVLSGGTVAPGVTGPFSTLNVAGPVTFGAGSTYRVQIDASGRTDSIVATGAATLSGGTVDVRAGTGTFTAGQSYRILSAAGGGPASSRRFVRRRTSPSFSRR
ncbi:autotransporter-associated beta strand repeat-containing protein [Methylobacterium persicinum]